MNPKLYLHFGTHKTGTTTIQKFAEANREELLRRGLLYPDYEPVVNERPYAHHQFSKAIGGQGTRLTLHDAKKLAAHWRKLALKNNANVLVSAEPMYRLVSTDLSLGWGAAREGYLERLAEVFKDFDVQAVIVFRRPDNFVHSLYQENVMQGLKVAKQPFEKFRDEVVDPFLRYSYHADLLQRFFPDLTVETFETLCDGNALCSNFYRLIGYDFQELLKEKQIRKSLTAQETRAKFYLNKSWPTEKQSNVMVGWLKRPEVQSILKAQYGDSKYHLWESNESRSDYLRSRADDLESLRLGFFKDRPFVFSEISKSDQPVMAPKLSDKTKSKLMLEAMFGEGVAGLPNSSKAYRK